MAKLVYTAITSLDGYVADEDGKFDWAAPDEEVHAFVNDLERPIGTYLCGRRLYDTMAVWETSAERPRSAPGRSRLRRDLAVGRQDRLFHDPDERVERTDPDRTAIRTRCGTQDQGVRRPGRVGGRPTSRRSSNPGWSGRRVSPVRYAGYCRRRHASASGPRSARTRAGGRTQVRQRRRASALPRHGLIDTASESDRPQDAAPKSTSLVSTVPAVRPGAVW